MGMNNYCKLIIVLLYCLPTIIMPMRTMPITAAGLAKQKAANKAVEYKEKGQLVPDNIIAVLDGDIKNDYLDYNQCLKNRQSESS